MMVSACAVDSTWADEESIRFAFCCGCKDEPVRGTIGWVGCVDLTDMAWVAVVERGFLRYVATESTLINEVPCAAEVE